MSHAMTEDRIFHADGATIAYQVSGSGGPPVAYAHGVLLSRAAVRGLGIFDLEAVADGRRLLLYGQRGHGHSTGRPQPEYHTFEQAGVDLLDLLTAAGFEEPVDFAGSSLGAAAALYAVLVAPQRFRRLVLLIPPAAWEGGNRPVRQWYLDTADEIDDIGASAWRQRWAQAPPLPIFADYPPGRFSPDVGDEVAAAALRGVAGSDLPAPAALATINQPALILAWVDDPQHPLATARELARLIPRATVRVAHTLDEVKTWTGVAKAFLARGGATGGVLPAPITGASLPAQ